MSSNSKFVQRTGKTVLAEAKHKTSSVWFQRLERFGFVIRGVIYFVIGLLALLLAIGAGGATTNPTSAIQLIGRQPLGKVFLVVIAAGLVGYSLWGFVRALFDPLGRGTHTKGVLARVGYFFSGIGYAALLIPTYQALMNKPGGSGSASILPASLTTGPLGKWLVIALGLVWIGVGIGNLVIASKAQFMLTLHRSTMSSQEVKTAKWLGQFGYAARGIVFVLVGLITLQTVFPVGTQQAQGFDGALAALTHAPYGAILLGAVAIGLALFGIYSAMCAKWTQIGTRHPA